MRKHYGIKQAPEALLALFGGITVILMGIQNISILMVIPLSIIILAGLHLVSPKEPATIYGLGIAYIVGAVLAGVLLLAAAIAPIGATSPADVRQFYTIVFPLIGLYAISILSLVVKFR